MASGNYFLEWAQKEIKDLQSKLDDVNDEVVPELGKEADDYAAGIVTPKIEKELSDLYESAVKGWYSAFTPKKYTRSSPGSLYGVFEIQKENEMYAGWQYMDDGLDKPRLYGEGTFNIYGLVFEGGSHGGPLFHYVPSVSTPIPDVFEPLAMQSEEKFQREFEKTGHKYFDQYIDERIAQRFREKYG